jgi:hypothetical protein
VGRDSARGDQPLHPQSHLEQAGTASGLSMEHGDFIEEESILPFPSFQSFPLLLLP